MFFPPDSGLAVLHHVLHRRKVLRSFWGIFFFCSWYHKVTKTEKFGEICWSLQLLAETRWGCEEVSRCCIIVSASRWLTLLCSCPCWLLEDVVMVQPSGSPAALNSSLTWASLFVINPLVHLQYRGNIGKAENMSNMTCHNGASSFVACNRYWLNDLRTIIGFFF